MSSHLDRISRTVIRFSARFRILKTYPLSPVCCIIVAIQLLSSSLVAQLPGIAIGPTLNPDNGHFYYLLEQSTWTSAQAKAVELGGNLTSISSQAERDWIVGQFSTADRELWIGLYDPNQAVNATDPLERAAEFVWANGEPVVYTDWNGNEPNNYEDAGEFYTAIWRTDGNPSYSGRWSDLVNDSSYAPWGVVEISAVPEPKDYAMLTGLILGGMCIVRHRKKKSGPLLSRS